MYITQIMKYLDEHKGVLFSAKMLQQKLGLENKRTIHKCMKQIVKYDNYTLSYKVSNGTRNVITSYYGAMGELNGRRK